MFVVLRDVMKSHKSTLPFLFGVCFAATALCADSTNRFAGKHLSEALRALQERGLRIIYSDRLVHPDMIVKFEPRAASAAQILDEILAPYRLTTRLGPRDSRLVVGKRDGDKTTRVSGMDATVSSAPKLVFPARVEMVHVSALVTRDDRPVRGLTAADFEVRDNGVLQEVELLASSDIRDARAVHVILALDRSGSVRGRALAQLKEAAIAFIDKLRPEDSVSLVTFADRIRALTPIDRSRERLVRAISEIQGGGTTSLHDAIYVASKISASTQGRSLLLVLTDGQDVGSWLQAQAILRVIRENDLMIYVVEKRADDTQSETLRQLASATSGRVWRLGRDDDLDQLMTRALEEVRCTYRLRYVPRGVRRDGRHEIRVRLTRTQGRVRARRAQTVFPETAYWTPSKEFIDAKYLSALEALVVSDQSGSIPIGAETQIPQRTAHTVRTELSVHQTLEFLHPPLCRDNDDSVSSRGYRRVLDMFRAGRASRAIAALMNCDTRQLVSATRKTARQSSQVAIVVALHTQVALELQLRSRPNDAALHLSFAEAIATEHMRTTSGRKWTHDPFWRRWLLATGYYHQAHSNTDAAERLFDICLNGFPDDATAWLAAGTIDEFKAYPDGFPISRPAVSLKIAQREAERRYRTALRLDPSLAEARLRLGRVLQRRGLTEEAERHYDRVTRVSHDPFLISFAWLFLGEIVEGRGDLPQAIRYYCFAVDVEPELQVAVVALSQALHRHGLRFLSREILKSMLAIPRSNQKGLWMIYHRGLGRRFPEAVQALRNDIQLSTTTDRHATSNRNRGVVLQ